MTDLLWTLVGLQVAMGAFDTLYHHELTERLAWRPGATAELRLHGVRNLLYALLFAMLGFTEPKGLLAIGMMAILVIEIVITLADFVEEDRSRALPATERVTHTLLALNYGAILMLLVPTLSSWAGEPAALFLVYYGWWSALAAVSALGVGLFGIRDLFAARRLARLRVPDATRLVEVLPPHQRVLVTGATGLIGSRLAAALVRAGHQVTVLTRDPAKAAKLGTPLTVVRSLAELPDDMPLDAIVNLAGEPIAAKPWTARQRRRILRSRLRVTREVNRLIARLVAKPKVLVNGSAVGWYGLRDDEALDETAEARPCFSHRLCAAWETEASRAEAYGVRVVRLRIGLVLSSEGGLLARLLLPFEFGLGGPTGHGDQWMSWIERDDLVRLIAHAIAAPGLHGAVNATAPEPVRNRDFAAALGRALRRPAVLPLPAWPLRLALGDFADELLLGGQRVVPGRATHAGFEFRYPGLEHALALMTELPQAPLRMAPRQLRQPPRRASA